MVDAERVKDLVAYMGDALAAYPHDFSVSELISAQATILTAIARVVIEKAPETRPSVIAVVQQILLMLTDATDPKKVH
jgi:hypothetical protein